MRPRAVLFWLAVLVLMVPAAALTGSRLSDPRSERGIQLAAFVPFALVPYTLLLVLLVTALLRSERRVLWVVPVLLVAAALVLHASWVAPLVSGDERAASSGASVTVLSSNLFFGRGDGDALVREVAARDVDVLVVSEVTTDVLRQMRDAGLSDLLPHFAGEPGAPETNTGTMVFSNQPVRLVEEVPGTTFTNLVVRTADLTLLAAHPAAPLDPDDWRSDHAALLGAVERDDPDLLVGDLNATLDHAPLRALVDAGLRDAAELSNAGLQPTWPANGLYPLLGLLPPTAPIDHLLLAPGWAVVSTDRIEVPDTDHLALLGTLAPAA